MIDTQLAVDTVEANAVFDKAKAKALGEVFTPPSLINEMLDSLPKRAWSNPDKTWFDPCAGVGNFPVFIVARLMVGLKKKIPSAKWRYKHIVENMLYMSELQPESCAQIEQTLNPQGEYKLNLHMGDTLTMPEDFFDLSWEDRRAVYPERCFE